MCKTSKRLFKENIAQIKQQWTAYVLLSGNGRKKEQERIELD
jgi:hypothetical protein